MLIGKNRSNYFRNDAYLRREISFLSSFYLSKTILIDLFVSREKFFFVGQTWRATSNTYVIRLNFQARLARKCQTHFHVYQWLVKKLGIKCYLTPNRHLYLITKNITLKINYYQTNQEPRIFNSIIFYLLIIFVI